MPPIKEIKMTNNLETFFNITVHLGDGLIWETKRHTFEGVNDFIKDLFDDEKVVRYTVEERRA